MSGISDDTKDASAMLGKGYQDTANRIDNVSADHAYFTISPRIVWAMCRNPFDFALWQTVKDIAGDSKECYISTPDLAILSMMSVGQVDSSRKHLIAVGLLAGEVRRDPGYQLPVWHIRVPDLWERSTVWSIEHRTIRSRIDFKRQQQSEIRAERDAARALKDAEHLSPGEKPNLEIGGFSPGEKPTTYSEKPPLPGETKKIEKEEPKVSVAAEAPARTNREKKGDMLDGIFAFAAMGADPAIALKARISEYPADVQSTILTLAEIFAWPAAAIPSKPARGGAGGAYAQWINETRQINEIIAGHGKAPLQASFKQCGSLSISHPAGIMWCLPAEVGKLAQEKKAMTQPDLEDVVRTLPPADLRAKAHAMLNIGA